VCERARVEERACVVLSVCKLACLFMTPFFAAEPDPKDWAKKEIPPDKQSLPSGIDASACMHDDPLSFSASKAEQVCGALAVNTARIASDIHSELSALQEKREKMRRRAERKFSKAKSALDKLQVPPDKFRRCICPQGTMCEGNMTICEGTMCQPCVKLPCVKLTHQRTITAAGAGLSQRCGFVRLRVSKRHGLAC
jgi:hypothetical protein